MSVDLPASAAEIPSGQFAAIYAGKLPEKQQGGKPYHINSTFSDIEGTWIGKLMLKFMNSQVKKMANDDESLLLMVKEMTGDIPLRQFSMANINSCIINGIIEMANGHFFRGVARMLNK